MYDRRRLALLTFVPALGFATAAGIASVAAWATSDDVVLPTGWKLSPPPGIVVSTKTLPQSATFTADGNHLVVVEGGAGSPGIRIVRPQTLETERDIAVRGAYGVPLADETSTGFWVGTGAQDSIAHYDAATGVTDRSIALPDGFWPASIARDSDRKTLAVSGDLANAVVFVDTLTGNARVPIKVGSHPAGLAFSRDGKTLYVANWGGASVSIVDAAAQRVSGTIAVGRHPETLLLSKDGTRLFASEPDDDAIGVIDTATANRIADVNVAPFVERPSFGRIFGASPTAMILSKDGTRLFVACSAANGVVVVDVAGATPRVVGAIPTGWYPTALAFENDGTTLDVVNGKGEGSRPNPQFDPFHPAANVDTSGYVAAATIGSIRRIAIPDDTTLAQGLQRLVDNASPAVHARASAPEMRTASDSPLRAGGPIHHIMYVIKENRTYDQVLGDIPGANGDPALTLFGERVTPNEHALAKRFGILDNTYAAAEVSADGHNWSMAAFANDYLEKMWPQNYGRRRLLYDFEDGATASVPHSGYLWNAAARAHVTLRNYGEFTTQATPGGSVTSHMADLDRVTDSRFTGYDLTVSDEAREAEWAREFDAYAKTGSLPQLEIVRLPNDHTAGTRDKMRTPAAYVAQNDLAVGRLVDTVSHSRYWRDTAIFIVEDDAQNGPDHVDAQRMTAYVVSPYARGGVIHERYSTSSVLRSIETVLGLPPMSSYDASAHAMNAAFGSPNFAPYAVRPPQTKLDEYNTAAAFRARDSARANFGREDGVPDAELNDIVWHAVRGSSASPPPYGRFDTR